MAFAVCGSQGYDAPMRSTSRLGLCVLCVSLLGCGSEAGDGTGGSTGATDAGTTSSSSTTTAGPESSGEDPTNEPSTGASSSSGAVDSSSGSEGSSTTGDVDPIEYAGAMNGYRWELPCEDPAQRDTCPWDPALLEGAVEAPGYTLRRETTVAFGGDPEVTYDVQIRIRGVTEAKDFTGGEVQEEHFQIGGTPGTNDYNIYAIEVGDPAQVYTLNRNAMGVGHYLFVMDYTVTLPIRGGAEVVLAMSDPNNIAIANPGGASGSPDPFVVPDIPPFPDPFYGQLIQMDVLAVTPQ